MLKSLRTFLKKKIKCVFFSLNIPAIHLNQSRIFEYFYEAELTVGAADKNIPASALRLSSKIKITGDSGSKYFIQVRVGTPSGGEKVQF